MKKKLTMREANRILALIQELKMTVKLEKGEITPQQYLDYHKAQMNYIK